MRFVKKFILFGVCMILLSSGYSGAEEYTLVNNIIQGSVSMTDRVPEGFFGSWKVVSIMSKTNVPQEFSKYSVDIWNLSKNNDVITLSNPVSGARASITVNDVKGDTVKFEKTTYEKDEKTIETPILTLEGNDNFYGIDRIEINTYNKNGLVKTDFIEYKVKAVKISGDTIPDIFGN